MLPTRYQVIFDESPGGVFLSGQKLSGIVIVENYVPKRIRAVFIKVTGTCRVKNLPSDRSDSFEDFDLFSRQVVLQEGFDNSLFDFPAGQHRYPFQIDLPIVLPSSFYGRFGFIHYEINIKLKADRAKDSSSKHPFLIMHVHTQYSDVIEPPLVRVCRRKICYCCCLIRSLLRVQVIAPSTSVSPGEMLYICIKIDNETNEKIKFIKLKLVKNIEYCLPNKPSSRCFERLSLAKTFLEDKNDLSGKLLVHGIRIPLTQPTTERFRLINIEYILLVYVMLPTCCEDDIDILIPITIDPGKENMRRVLRRLQAKAASRLSMQSIQTLLAAQLKLQQSAMKEYFQSNEESYFRRPSSGLSAEPPDIGFKPDTLGQKRPKFEVYDPLRNVRNMKSVTPPSSMSNESFTSEGVRGGRRRPPPIGLNVPFSSNSSFSSIEGSPISNRSPVHSCSSREQRDQPTTSNRSPVCSCSSRGEQRDQPSTSNRSPVLSGSSRGELRDQPSTSLKCTQPDSTCQTLSPSPPTKSDTPSPSCSQRDDHLYLPSIKRAENSEAVPIHSLTSLRCLSLPTLHPPHVHHCKPSPITYSSKGAYGFIATEDKEKERRVINGTGT